MKKIFALILIMSIALSAITVEDAWDTASKYKLPSENININPPTLTQSGGVDYWIFEISAYGAIKTMIPVDAETGEVNINDGILEGIKVHYLSNFFATNSDIEDFLDNTKQVALTKKNLFESAKQTYESEVSDSVSLTKESAYLSSLESAVVSSDSLIDKAVALKSRIGKIESVADISDIQTSFTSLFGEQLNFAEKLDDVSTTAADLRKEINEKMEAEPDFQALGAQIKQSLSYPTLISDKNQLELDVQTNMDVIDSFFEGIDLNTDQYLLRLQERAMEIPDEELVEWLEGKITEFAGDYTYIAIEKANEIDPQYDDEISALNTKITDLTGFYSSQDYDQAKILAFDIDDKITFLKSKVGTWPPDCSGGQYWSGSSCVCPLGQVFENGICEIQTQDYEINWWLVGGLGLLIAVLIIYRLKDKLFGVKQNDEDKELSDDNSFYSAFE